MPVPPCLVRSQAGCLCHFGWYGGWVDFSGFAGRGTGGWWWGDNMVSRDRIRALLVRMTSLGIHRDDLEEEFVRGAGAGGQKINKTSSTVRLRHVPSNIEVRCQEERSLTQNRYLARETLCERMEKRRAEALQSSKAAVARKRRQQVKRSKGVKAGMVRDKRQRGNVKSLRKRPSAED